MPSKNQRQVRWNSEVSTDNTYEGNLMVRYHVVVIDDKWREKKVGDIFSHITKLKAGLIPIRRKEDHVEGTRFRYLLVSYDSPISPSFLDFGKISTPIFQDPELYERESSRGIEEYVDRFCSNKG
jgi:hypothetical protein